MHALLVLTQQRGSDEQHVTRNVIAWIRLRIQFSRGARRFQVPRHEIVVTRGDVEPLALPHSRPKLVRFSYIFPAFRRLTSVAIRLSQAGVRHGKIRIEVDGPLTMPNAADLVASGS